MEGFEFLPFKAVQAGADVLLMPADYEKAYKGLLAAVRDGTISEARIDEVGHQDTEGQRGCSIEGRARIYQWV
jgi:beta-glucosidase-like glycosyl hydrolase